MILIHPESGGRSGIPCVRAFMMPSLCRLLLPVLACAALSGCLTHVAAPENSASLLVRWVEDYEIARRDASASGRPILAVLVAGDLRDKC